jgi:hypothetical protein
MEARDRWRISGQMPPIVAMLAGWRLREVLNVKTGLQIANVYAGLNRTNLALWYQPLTLMNMRLKTPAIAISRFGGDSGAWHWG